MKFYREDNFKKEIKTSDGILSVHSNANHSLKDLVEGEFYLLNLKINGDIKSGRCLYIIKEGKLHLHKESFWIDTNGNDLDTNNYLEYSEIRDCYKQKIFFKIPLEDFISKDHKRY